MFTYDNFSYKSFIDYVMGKLKLDNVEHDIKDKIEKEITQTLANRILISVMSAMSDEDLKQFDANIQEQTDMSEFEILYHMVDDIPALAEIMMKNINDLADELVKDVEDLDKVLAEKAKEIAKK